jgi:hypothetical protein
MMRRMYSIDTYKDLPYSIFIFLSIFLHGP